ncbi:9-O-acetylesterase [Caulobacter vibrioides]|uniref:sialate O-acetylesterase n=1 Tax=Caulobacter vibrioides TaxID=155892 RepID=UPI000BB49755|nr:sialate O-acetylesterase [Caulobacter vibrioides]ATC25943.1 9-O-acetylesterase [Caulobacter vibrioides]AZH14085.1 9-O-acetylesterase [Caulobacter vibrioides]PLR16414.1 9-O-acetylesterase [Caulobacter vibrioides]
MRRLAPILLAAALASPASAQSLLNGLFADHAVVQRDRPLPVFGTAKPGETVTASFAGQTLTAKAGPDGAWRVDFPATPAGGPYAITAATASARASASDVLVGDVWLCSGQSNMEMQVSASGDAWNQINNGAANDTIRMATIEKADARSPAKDFKKPPVWRPTNKENVGAFSASCFYFARELQKTRQVPLGLIHASWGGSGIEAWMTPTALRKVGGYDDAIAVLNLSITDQAAASRRWGEVIKAWWSAKTPGQAALAPWTGAGTWTAAPRDLGIWERWGVPALAEFNGVVWFKTEIELTAAQAAQAATLGLGQIDEMDTTYLNGVGVGATSGSWLERRYALPAGSLKPGKNTLVVSAYDTYANGGMYGDPAKRVLTLADGTALPLTNWSYRIEPRAGGDPPRAPWDTLSGVSTLYNGMLAPMGPYAYAGLAWYQGETNVGRDKAYVNLLGAFMAERRQGQSPDMPALVVQLADYGAYATAPGLPAATAALRDAQRRAVAADPRAGLVVTHDIGDPYDIHPANKQEVGRRLALAARRLYGEPVTTGPEVVSAKRTGDTVVVSFAQVGGGRLVSLGSDRVIGFELCDTTCRWVDGRVDGTSVVLSGTGSKVRFAWADSPSFNLFDAEGLPAGPFEVEVQ